MKNGTSNGKNTKNVCHTDLNNRFSQVLFAAKLAGCAENAQFLTKLNQIDANICKSNQKRSPPTSKVNSNVHEETLTFTPLHTYFTLLHAYFTLIGFPMFSKNAEKLQKPCKT